MQYSSSHHKSSPVSLSQAMMHSVASDGGLYFPFSLPRLPMAVFNNISEMSLREISYFTANTLFNSDISSAQLKAIGDETFNFPIPLKEIEKNIYALELFHGPTMAVKDISARFMARLLSTLHTNLEHPLNVLVATNGNSGNAVAHGFFNVKGVNVYTLYSKDIPYKRVSQFASLGGNVHAIRVNGSIDDCRRIIAQTLEDKKLNDTLRFTCANSANIGRVLPNIIYFFWAYAQLIKNNPKASNIHVSVPCGSAGDLVAGCYAKQMGLPISKLIGACNANGAFTKFLYGEKIDDTKESMRTLAFSMDTSRLSNACRFIEMCDGNLSKLQNEVIGYTCPDSEIREAIADVYTRTGYILDPHSATAYISLKKNMPKDATGIFMATANPARSSQLIQETIGIKLHPPVNDIRRSHKTTGNEITLPATYPAFRKYILQSHGLDAQRFS